MRFVNNFELSSILAQPHICSSNRLGAMASQRDEGILKWQRKLSIESCSQGLETSLCNACKNHYASMPRRMAAVVEANGGHTKY